ncbi:MAG: DEAD/DEAH box helicase [Aeromonas veronii]
MIVLRDYQNYAIECLFGYFQEGKTGNPLIAAPTGVGKSIIIAEAVRQIMQWPGQQVMMVTHVKELIEQNYEKLLSIWPTAPAGIYSAGLGKKEMHYPITFASIQSIHTKAAQVGHIDILFVDEAHTIPAKSNTMYRKFIAALLKINPKLKIIGLTATPYRLGFGKITDEGHIFTDICCDMTTLEAFNWFLDQGYLCWLNPRKTSVEIDLTGVSITAGDYNSREMEAATDKEYITQQAVDEIIEASLVEGRKHWLIFGTGVDHVEHIVTEINRRGYTAVAVHSKMTGEERDANIKAFKECKVDALVNMGVLTTGFDDPRVDLIGMLRATQSPGLWVQMLGRGTRPFFAPGFDLSTKEGRLAAIDASEKPDCLVLDFAANSMRLGPINDPRMPKKPGKGGGPAPTRCCDGINKKTGKQCKMYIHASLRVCPHCGKEFPPEVKFDEVAAKEDLIAKRRKKDDILVGVFEVGQVFYKRDHGRNGSDFVMVTYQCGLRRFKVPLMLEHENSYVRKKSRDWWRKATGIDDGELIPVTTNEALERLSAGEAQTPRNIRVHTNKKPYPEVLVIDYMGELDNERGTTKNLSVGVQ